MFQGTQENHYTRLYSCKHFRNRVIQLQQLCIKNNLDAILLAIGMDTFHDEEMNKLQNWLLYGLSSSDIMGSALSDSFSDSFFVISKDGFQGYTNSAGFKELSNLTTLLSNCNLYTILKSDENDSDRAEVIKVAKFYEMIHDKKTVGIPVRKLTVSDYIGSESQLLEKWPIIQAYGLDMVGGGFFTMKHQFVNVRDDLQKTYAEYDAFAIFRIVYDEIDRFNAHYYDNFFKINKDTFQQRLERTEQDLIDAFWLRYEFSLLSRKISGIPAADDGLPLPRALIGKNTNKPYNELSNKEDRIYKHNQVDNKDSALHFTVEYTEKNTNVRFARTYFLSNLSQHYMQDYYFSEEEEYRQQSEQGKINELNSRFLFNAYLSLLSTFMTISSQILRNDLKPEDAQGQAFSVFSKYLATRIGKEDTSQYIPNGKDSFTLHVKEYNTLGEEVPFSQSTQKLIVIRMQQSDLRSPYDDSELGSVLYAQTYFLIDNETQINITTNVPNLQLWYTTNKHYENLPMAIQTEKNLQSEKLGDRVNYYTDLIGVIPIKEQFVGIFQDIALTGKWTFYEKGFIFIDHRLNAFVLSYEDIESFRFFVADEIWVEIKAKQQKSLPANILCGDTFYLKINQQIFNDKFRVFQTLQETTLPDLKIERIYQPCPVLETSLTFKNFIYNQKYNKTLSSDYLNFAFLEPEYREILEFQVMNEFNKIRSKEFMNFSQFHSVYIEGQQRPYQANITAEFVDKLKQQTVNKINLILISGIPGAGKSKLADYLTKQLQNENVNAVAYKTTNVQDLVKFSHQKFISNMLLFREDNSKVQTIVAALPSYHHLKKVIFELKKNDEFSNAFDIKYIITKVHARNFYMNKNRNLFQFLIENCMKGVTQAIVFEKSNVSQQEVDIMYKQLQNANFENNILSTHGKTFALEDLASILINSNEKFNIIYNKFFYGMEKEGKSAYFQEKQVTGTFVQYRYPFREDLITSTIMRDLNIPIQNAEQLAPKENKELEENKANGQTDEELTREEKRKIEKEEKQRKKIEADLEPERLLKEEIDITKRTVHSQDLYMERLRGYVLVEGKEEEQDYEMIVNFNEVSLKPLKNQDKRLQPEQLGVIVYGRNLNEDLIREVFKTCRTQLSQKKNLRTRENITKDEIEMLKEKYVGEFLPEGWFYNGSFYLDVQGKTANEHPNLEHIIKHYIDEQNGLIGDFNRQVQKELKTDQKKYEDEAQ